MNIKLTTGEEISIEEAIRRTEQDVCEKALAYYTAIKNRVPEPRGRYADEAWTDADWKKHRDENERHNKSSSVFVYANEAMMEAIKRLDYLMRLSESAAVQRPDSIDEARG